MSPRQGCKWRGLPQRFGNWHTIYTRMNRWVEERRARRRLRETAARATGPHQNRSRVDGLDHREGSSRRHRCVKKTGPQAIGKSRGGWTTKIHMVAADARTAITFALSPGQAHDAQHGRELLGGLGPLPEPLPLLMDGAYEDDQTRQLALDFGWIPVVPPKRTRLKPWEFESSTLSPPQRGREALPPAQGIPPNLLPLRQARRDVPRLPPLRPHRRGSSFRDPTLVLTRPSLSSMAASLPSTTRAKRPAASFRFSARRWCSIARSC